MIAALLSLSFRSNQEGRRTQSACPDVLSKIKWGYWSPASTDEHQSQVLHKGRPPEQSLSVIRKQELKVYQSGKSRSSRENGFHKQSPNSSPGTSVWLARWPGNQKSCYLKNIQRVVPAGIVENALGGTKSHFFLASSSSPKAKRKKKSTSSASLLIFALQNLFVCAEGKVPFGLSQHLHVWVRQSLLRMGWGQEK